MRDLPILSIRGEGNSSVAENPRAVGFLRSLRSTIATEPAVRGDLISARVETISDGSRLTVAMIMDGGLEARIVRNGRTLVLRTPDPYMTGMSSRADEGDLPNTIAAMLDMAIRTIDADLAPEEEREALDRLRFAHARAIAARVAGANEGIDQVTVRPPGPIDDAMSIHASREPQDALVPLHPSHLAWMPIRCTGISVITTSGGIIIAIRQHAGSVTVPIPTDPIARMRAIGDAMRLPDAPEPVITDLDWEVVF